MFRNTYEQTFQHTFDEDELLAERRAQASRSDDDSDIKTRVILVALELERLTKAHAALTTQIEALNQELKDLRQGLRPTTTFGLKR